MENSHKILKVAARFCYFRTSSSYIWVAVTIGQQELMVEINCLRVIGICEQLEYVNTDE